MDVQPGKPASKGPAEWFTGDVWIDPIASGHEPNRLSLSNVHFAPGARTAWHSHTIAQALHVTEGEGLVQARGEAVTRIRPGDVVTIVGNEWHWHGAAPGHFMTHLSLTEGDTEWGDHVTNQSPRPRPVLAQQHSLRGRRCWRRSGVRNSGGLHAPGWLGRAFPGS